MVSKLEEFKRYLKDYRKLVLLCIDNEDALKTFCGKRDATEILKEIQGSYPNWWKMLFGLTLTLNMLDRTTGDNLPKFRYEFKTLTLGIPRIIEHPTNCIDYVFNAYNSIYRPQPLLDKIFYPSILSQVRTMLRNKVIIDLGQQEKKYEEANLGALQDKDSLQPGTGGGGKANQDVGKPALLSVETTLFYHQATGTFSFNGMESLPISKTPKARVRDVAKKLMKWWKERKPCPMSEFVKDTNKKTPQWVYEETSKIGGILKDIKVNTPSATSDGYPPPDVPLNFHTES